MRSRGFLALTAALVATLTPVISPPTASATGAVQCTPGAAIYTVHGTGGLWLYQHLEPETGAFSWAPQQQINTFGADSKRLAGPDGVIYSIVSSGEFRRRRWNGSGWDTFAGGSQYEVIDTNSAWARYITPEYRNRITIDADGYIYTVEPDGNLHVRSYNPTTHTWTHGILDTHWDQYDLIAAAGRGIIYVRVGTADFNGILMRYDFHTPSQRDFETMHTVDGDSNWHRFSRVFSPGGDILYAVRADTGNLEWYRLQDSNSNWWPGSGAVVGTGWQNEYETFAAPDACHGGGEDTVPRPVVTPEPDAPVTLLRSANGHVHYSYVDGEGRGVYGDIASIFGGSAGLAAVPGLFNVTGITTTGEQLDGRIQIAATGLDGEVYGNTRTAANGPWSTTLPLGGFMAGPTLFKRSESIDTLGLYGIAADGNPWERQEWNPNEALHSWHRFQELFAPAPIPEPDGHLISVTTDSATLRLIAVGRCVYIQSRGWFFTDETISVCGAGSGFFPGGSAIVAADNSTRLFTTDLDGVVQTIRGTPGTPSDHYPATWTPIPGITAAGPPSAILAPDGLFKIVVRANDGFVYYTSQTAPGATTFNPWQEITNYTEETATDPTALAVPEANTWVVAYRTDLDIPRLRRYVPGLSAATSAPFADIPITPPTP